MHSSRRAFGSSVLPINAELSSMRIASARSSIHDILMFSVETPRVISHGCSSICLVVRLMRQITTRMPVFAIARRCVMVCSLITVDRLSLK